MRLGVVMAMLAGCSWLAGKGPHRGSTGELECPASLAVLDTTAAVAGLGGGLTVAALDLAAPRNREFQGLAAAIIGLPAVVIGTVYAFSARSGWRERCRCKRVLAETKRQRGDHSSFSPLPYSPVTSLPMPR